jgi:hypothetical protein
MVRADSYGVYYILKSMEQGPTFRVTVPKYIAAQMSAAGGNQTSALAAPQIG